MFKTRWSWMHSGRLRIRRTMLSTLLVGVSSPKFTEKSEKMWLSDDRLLHTC